MGLKTLLFFAAFTMLFPVTFSLAGPRSCSSAFASVSPELNVAVKALVEMGYTPAVASQISLLYPKLVKKILKERDLGRPLRLYRGLATRPEKYNPMADPKKWGYMDGEKFASEDIKLAFHYATKRLKMWKKSGGVPADMDEYGVILELQAPKFFYETRLHPYTNMKLMPDDRPFTVRIGVVPTRKKVGLKNIRWMTTSEFFKKYGSQF